VDIAVITETKKKLKGTIELSGYVLIYSGVKKEKLAYVGVTLLIKKPWRNGIHSKTGLMNKL
jgi:hypothetical protein